MTINFREIDMEWYSFIEKIPKRNELILICISSTRVNQTGHNNIVLNPVYQCIFKKEYDSSVLLKDLILVSGKSTLTKKSTWYYAVYDDYVHWARLK